MKTLKPCPFCGNAEAPKLITYHARTSAQVECNSLNQGCGVIIQKRSAEEATDAWNKRVSDITPPPIETALEGMSLVPDQPTQLMRDAGNKALDMLKTTPGMLLGDRSYYAYRAMLATANPLMHAHQYKRRAVEYISAVKQPLNNEELARTLISLKREKWKL